MTNAIAQSTNLPENAIGEEVGPATLTSPSLSENLIEEERAPTLGDAIRNNKTLIRLDLSGNGIGARLTQEISNALQHNVTIQEIPDLEQNNQRITASLERNRRLPEQIFRKIYEKFSTVESMVKSEGLNPSEIRRLNLPEIRQFNLSEV
ncbi:MAG: hypothetical protein KGP29_02120 [Proteobacteria bacterium]|nr:hypothetical protein [Pseudomonadota bacterium]